MQGRSSSCGCCRKGTRPSKVPPAAGLLVPDLEGAGQEVPEGASRHPPARALTSRGGAETLGGWRCLRLGPEWCLQGWGVIFFVCVYLFFVFLGPHLQHMEVPRLGV